MDNMDEMLQGHPRVAKLVNKRKFFLVVSEDEPYFSFVYRLIKLHETAKGSWSKEDEEMFRREIAKHEVKNES